MINTSHNTARARSETKERRDLVLPVLIAGTSVIALLLAGIAFAQVFSPQSVAAIRYPMMWFAALAGLGTLAGGAALHACLRMQRDNAATREKLEEAVNTKTAFLANMSHELRTPMTGVIGLADLLSRTELDEEQRRSVEGLKSAGQSMVNIVNDILDLSKIEAGMMTVETIDYRPGKVLRDIITLYTPMAEGKFLDFTLDMDECFDRTYQGDPTRTFQIISNLVSNAMKFTSDGGVEIRGSVETNPTGQLLRVTITDTGIGMDAATLDRIFDPFSQADESTARRFGGTGLGLSICRNLANLCGGHLMATSEPDVGSTFILTLPARPSEIELPDAQDEIDKEAYCKADVPEGMRVLVADDVPTNRMVLKAMLERYKAVVTLVEDGASAIEAYRDQAFDLLLTDIQMPEMSGVEVCRAIRKMEAELNRSRMPVFAITANVFDHQSETYLAAGMDGVVHKPFALADLESALVSGAPQEESGVIELF